MQQEIMTGSLFPLFPLRVKCQNHERVPISTISPILVANVYKIREIGPSDFFPLVKCQNHERVPISTISPKGEVPKPWEGPYFPYFFYFGPPK